MTIGNDILTASVIIGPMGCILWYFFRRWMERMERIETKVDALMESKGKFISREEYDKGMSRAHQRMDEHFAEEQELIDRVAHLEGQALRQGQVRQ